ncbi:hypothetical protein ACFPM7_12150 [Actinokineospora guangxiensis]|uniref:Type II toxin-antitoxin system VapC family toxin n=1 Tax=Actinokineospora guangxiensis TaxID=1490288 RepID=A0ABW0EP79_9PSEU
MAGVSVLLDTSVGIDIEVVDLGRRAHDELFVSAVTIAELAQGPNTSDPLQRSARHDRFYWTLDQCDIVDFGLVAARQYGTLCGLVRLVDVVPV